jgi:inner membrane protein
VVARIFGSAEYLHWHRHFTHAIVFLPLVAVLPVLFVRFVLRRRFPWRAGYIASLVAVGTHPLLDLLNIYGVRIALPFTSEWYRLDITNVVDVWMSAVLLLAAFGPFLSKLVSQEIGARSSSGRGWAIFALTFLLAYNAGRAVLHERAVAMVDSRLYGGREPLRVSLLPSAFNPFRWGSIVETEDAYWLQRVSVLDGFNPDDGRRFYKPEVSPAMERARETRPMQVFLDFAQYPLWRMEPVAEPEGGIRLMVTDMRFAEEPFERFVASAVLDSNLRVVSSRFEFQPD